MRSILLASLLTPLLASQAGATPADNDCSLYTPDPYYGSLNWSQVHPGSHSIGQDGIQFADINGDGRADAIAVATDVNGWGMNGNMRITVRLAVTYPEVKFSDTTTVLDLLSSWEAFSMRRIFFVDVNNDTFADAVSILDSQVVVRLNTGGALGAPTAWTSDPFSGSWETFMADVDNDHQADLIAVSSGGGVTVRRSNGAGFDPARPWTGRRQSAVYGTHGTAFADVTGDGRADAIAVRDDGIWVRPAIGTGDSASFAYPEVRWTNTAWWDTYGMYFADLTGDGKADAIMTGPSGVQMRLSTGSAFSVAQTWLTVGVFRGDVTTAFAPVSTLGRADMLMVMFANGAIKGRPNLWSYFGLELCWDV